MKTKRIKELNRVLTNQQLFKARFEATGFYNNLTQKEQKECIEALIYAGTPIKELDNIFELPTKRLYHSKYYTPKNVLKRFLNRFILHPMTVALTVYLLIILSTIILTLKLY